MKRNADLNILSIVCIQATHNQPSHSTRLRTATLKQISRTGQRLCLADVQKLQVITTSTWSTINGEQLKDSV